MARDKTKGITIFLILFKVFPFLVFKYKYKIPKKGKITTIVGLNNIPKMNTTGLKIFCFVNKIKKAIYMKIVAKRSFCTQTELVKNKMGWNKIKQKIIKPMFGDFFDE